MKSHHIVAFVAAAVLSHAAIPAIGQTCVGDCDGSGTVDITKIIRLVNIVLGNFPASSCPSGIPAGGEANITLIIQAVNITLAGGACPAPCPYFPMAEGKEWVYAPGFGDGPRVDTITGMDAIDGTNVFNWMRVEAAPDNYIETRRLTCDDGVLRMRELQGFPMDPPWTLVPSNPIVGQTWEEEGVIRSEGGTNQTFHVTWSVHSTNATITVPAGIFANCLVIRGHDEEQSGGVKVDEGYSEQWYALGVGLVSDKDYEYDWTQVYHSEDLVRVGQTSRAKR